MCVLEREVCL